MIINRYKFKKKDEVIFSETKILLDGEIDSLKELSALKANCSVDEISVEIDVIHLSNYDVSINGMFDVNEEDLIYIKGVKLNIKIGSDEYLDALNNNTLDKYIELY